MAHRDSKAGHAFMYVDVAKLLKEQAEVAAEARAGAPVSTEGTPTNHFPITAPGELPTISEGEREIAMQKIQGNLDRLQSLHHKLHAMLADLSKIPGKK